MKKGKFLKVLLLGIFAFIFCLGACSGVSFSKANVASAGSNSQAQNYYSDLYEGYLESVFYGAKKKPQGVQASTMLTSNVARSMYEELAEFICKVAKGESSSTVIEFDETSLQAMGADTSYTAEELSVGVIDHITDITNVFYVQFEFEKV